MVASTSQSGKVSIDTMGESSTSSADDIATQSRVRTKRKVFPFVGAALPSEQSKVIWNFYNPSPTRIGRPELEADLKEWEEFLDGVDEILVPVNKSRKTVFFMTCFAMLVVLALVIGLFTFAQSLWTQNNLMLMALYVLIGFSIVPVTLLLTIKFGVPSRVHEMEDKMVEMCKEEAKKRSESGRGKWRIKFNDRGERGYQVEVSMQEVSSVDLCDMA